MSTMKAVVFSEVGAAPKVDDIPIPEPGDGQVLVKSLWAAINPIDGYCANTGLLVVGWPLTLGADASGVIVKQGPNVPANFSVGTHVFGCTRIGSPGYGSCAEYLLMDAQTTFTVTPKMKEAGIGYPEAATLGAGLETAALGIFLGLHTPLAAVERGQGVNDEWLLVLGGASSVGKCAVQLARAAGYQVVTSCSPSSSSVVEKLGAKWFSYRDSVADQVKAVVAITGKPPTRIFDAVAADNPELAKALFAQSDAAEKYFTTTNDWSGVGDFEGGKTYNIGLGPVGREEATELNKAIASYIEMATPLVESKKVVPSDYTVIGDGGFESAIEAYKFQSSGKAGNKKVVVKIQDEK